MSCKTQILDAWAILKDARSKWVKQYGDIMESPTHRGKADALAAHKQMVGSAEMDYNRLVGPQVTTEIPEDCGVGLGELLYH